MPKANELSLAREYVQIVLRSTDEDAWFSLMESRDAAVAAIGEALHQHQTDVDLEAYTRLIDALREIRTPSAFQLFSDLLEQTSASAKWSYLAWSFYAYEQEAVPVLRRVTNENRFNESDKRSKLACLENLFLEYPPAATS